MLYLFKYVFDTHFYNTKISKLGDNDTEGLKNLFPSIFTNNLCNYIFLGLRLEKREFSLLDRLSDEDWRLQRRFVLLAGRAIQVIQEKFTEPMTKLPLLK